MSSYTISDAASGLENTFNISKEVLLFVTKAMEAVESIGALTGNAKKIAVFDMARGVIENFDEIQSTLCKLIDMVKSLYNQARELIKEIFD